MLYYRIVSQPVVENALLSDSQSARRRFSSTETALLKVQNDSLVKYEINRELLFWFTFEAADYSLLLNTSQSDFGVTDICLKWFGSHLS